MRERYEKGYCIYHRLCGNSGRPPGYRRTAAFAVDITGHWKGSNGVEYDITQVGTAFNWKVPATGEIGVGTINGKDCSAGWPFGFATGMIVTNPSGAAIEISWSNGVVFRRPAPGGGTGPGTGPGTGTAPGGGTTSELQYNFGPNPGVAWRHGVGEVSAARRARYQGLAQRAVAVHYEFH